jgi:hypothetical protein
MKFSIVVIALSIAIRGAGQTANTATMDTTDFPVKGTLTVQGYIDSYYAFNFNEPSSGDQPYFVSMARHNELTINLAYIDIKYTGSIVRARFVPGFGTYINENYAAETGVLKNIVEASAGIKLSKKRASGSTLEFLDLPIQMKVLFQRITWRIPDHLHRSTCPTTFLALS